MMPRSQGSQSQPQLGQNQLLWTEYKDESAGGGRQDMRSGQKVGIHETIFYARALGVDI